ncbi:predicted protein [Coccidioides posadasii str. Silveira]|uniref:Predicted protein n=1 Tax=Coccidioides posadasii (strain RMSCC 757 / Silveira) TaxID=443226 RepID=E9CRH6_COCPS|nr:predicted protein [Coccidioides posadasii str. Silveira]
MVLRTQRTIPCSLSDFRDRQSGFTRSYIRSRLITKGSVCPEYFDSSHMETPIDLEIRKNSDCQFHQSTALSFSPQSAKPELQNKRFPRLRGRSEAAFHAQLTNERVSSSQALDDALRLQGSSDFHGRLPTPPSGAFPYECPSGPVQVMLEVQDVRGHGHQ